MLQAGDNFTFSPVYVKIPSISATALTGDGTGGVIVSAGSVVTLEMGGASTPVPSTYAVADLIVVQGGQLAFSAAHQYRPAVLGGNLFLAPGASITLQVLSYLTHLFLSRYQFIIFLKLQSNSSTQLAGTLTVSSNASIITSGFVSITVGGSLVLAANGTINGTGGGPPWNTSGIYTYAAGTGLGGTHAGCGGYGMSLLQAHNSARCLVSAVATQIVM
jgi:hypothetical protein